MSHHHPQNFDVSESGILGINFAVHPEGRFIVHIDLIYNVTVVLKIPVFTTEKKYVLIVVNVYIQMEVTVIFNA